MATVHYSLAISEEAREQLRALPKESRRRVGERLSALQINLTGDVKKLAAARKNTGCGSGITACYFGWKRTRYQCTL